MRKGQKYRWNAKNGMIIKYIGTAKEVHGNASTMKVFSIVDYKGTPKYPHDKVELFEVDLEALEEI